MNGGLLTLDWAIIAMALGVLLAIAWFAGRDQKDTEDFFLAKRKIPVWAATFSFVATEISAMTIVGVPAVGFSENWQYLQFFIGSAAARILIGYFFIPSFYKYGTVTIYEFLGKRFGVSTQYCSSAFFFITRLFASGVRLYAASLAVSVIMGWPLIYAIIFFSVISVFFIGFGGIRAVVWTGIWEAFAFYLAGAMMFYAIFNASGFSLSEFLSAAIENNKLSVINWGFNFSDPNIFLIAILNGVFGSMAAFGTDQELMQRLLTLNTRRESQKSIILTIFATLPLVTLYLAVGTAIFVYYKAHPGAPLPDNSDKILSHFALNFFPAGFKGIFLAAVILASIDSPLSSLTSSFITDIYRPLSGENNEARLMKISRASIVAFGVILACVALLCQNIEGMLWLAFKINGLTAGSLLGIFLLGIFTSRSGDRGNVTAMITAFVVCLATMILSEKKIIAVGWSWFIVIGTVCTFLLAFLLSSKQAQAENN
ncbi:MAG: sodium:solute symporter [Elusimicrobiota bacterium]